MPLLNNRVPEDGEIQQAETPLRRFCYGKAPWETFQQSLHLALEKDLSKGGDQPDNTTQQLSAAR